MRRAVELAHLGKVSKAFGALTSGGVLPLEEAAVRDSFSAFLQPNNEPPIAGWREFVVQSGGAEPGSTVYKFELGECEIIGPNGESRMVDTLEYASATPRQRPASPAWALIFSPAWTPQL